MADVVPTAGAPIGEGRGEIEGFPQNPNRMQNPWFPPLRHELSLLPRRIKICIIILMIISTLSLCATVYLASSINIARIDTSAMDAGPTMISNINSRQLTGLEKDKLVKDKIALFVELDNTSPHEIEKAFQSSKRYNFYEPNGVGMPLKYDNKTQKNIRIKFGTFNNTEMTDFINKLVANKVNFIRMKHHFFNNMENLDDFSSLIMFRNPLSRIISKYFQNKKYSKHLAKYETLDDKLKWFCKNAESIESNNNYYVRYLNDLDKYTEIQEIHFIKAKQILDKFDIISILEFESTWKNIEKYYNVDLRKLDPTKINNNKHENPTTEFEQWFRTLNKWDFRLYEYAVHKALSINVTNV